MVDVAKNLKAPPSLSGARTVTAEHSGTYSAACDGYETVLTPEFLKDDVTASKLNRCSRRPGTPRDRRLGREPGAGDDGKAEGQRL